MQFQLVFVSTPRPELDGEQVWGLMEELHADHRSRGVTGFLVWKDDLLFFVVEGAEECVRESFSKARRDRRQVGASLIFERQIDQRSFGDWLLAYDGESVSAACIGALPLTEFHHRLGNDLMSDPVLNVLAGSVLKIPQFVAA